MGVVIEEDAPLGARTTFELGGRARWSVGARTEGELRDAIAFAEGRGVPFFVLGGGSNLVVLDEGFGGVVLTLSARGVTEVPDGARAVRWRIAAGEPWDELVARSVAEGLTGLECLSGIPGLAGAAPIQNIGAYGHELGDVLVDVEALDRTTGVVTRLPKSECELEYRDSRFKREPGRWIVTAITFRLERGAPPAIRYAELARALGPERAPTSARVREVVLALRRSKSMVLDSEDENRRSAGSFFTNPIVPSTVADALVARAVAAGVVNGPDEVPRWPVNPPSSAGLGPNDARSTKLAAGWLIERAGIAKGLVRGNVGVSTKHALALVNRGGGTARELLALAREVRDRVRERFGVTLVPEPVILGPNGPVAL